MSEQERTRLNSIIAANPEIQALLTAYRQQREGLSILEGARLMASTAEARAAALRAAGVPPIPDGYVFNLNSGQIVEEQGVPWWAWTLPAIAFAPVAIGALGAGGGAAAAGVAGSSAAAASTGVSSTVGALIAGGSSIALGVYQASREQEALERQREAQIAAQRAAQQSGGLFGGNQTTLLLAAAIALVIVVTR